MRTYLNFIPGFTLSVTTNQQDTTVILRRHCLKVLEKIEFRVQPKAVMMRQNRRAFLRRILLNEYTRTATTTGLRSHWRRNRPSGDCPDHSAQRPHRPSYPAIKRGWQRRLEDIRREPNLKSRLPGWCEGQGWCRLHQEHAVARQRAPCQPQHH